MSGDIREVADAVVRAECEHVRWERDRMREERDEARRALASALALVERQAAELEQLSRIVETALVGMLAPVEARKTVDPKPLNGNGRFL